MLETKDQKHIFLAALVLVILLGTVTISSSPDFLYKERPNNPSPGREVLDAQKYLAYLDSLQIDPASSKQLFEEILSREDIQKEVEAELQANQASPAVSLEAEFLAQPVASSREALADYLAKLSGSILNFNSQTGGFNREFFASVQSDAAKILDSELRLIEELYKLPPPSDAVKLRDAVVLMQHSYEALLVKAKEYDENPELNPWPDVYKQYLAINQQAEIVDAEVQKLANKYQISQLPIQPIYAFDPQNSNKHGGLSPIDNFTIIKQAHAFLGVGDVTITVGDIPRIIKEAAEEGLVASFSQFMGVMLNKLVAKIETNYKIANFLFYTDALVAGQYTDDYLEKYVNDQIDRQIIKRFIPQLACGKNREDLKPVFQAKAKQYLGFDVSALQPSDPQFYEKLGRVGDPLSFSAGWDQYYQSIADAARSEAEKAAERELLSPGVKSPRDVSKNAIAISVNNIVSVTRASLSALLNLGNNSSKNFISGFVAKLTENLVNKFVFQGAVESQGALAVLKEQKVCLSSAQLTPVLPLDLTTYVPPAAVPTQEELLERECAKYPRGCTVLPNNGGAGADL